MIPSACRDLSAAHGVRNRANGMRMLSLFSLLATLIFSVHAASVPDQVEFASRDWRIALKGYVFLPKTPPPWPAVVMLHGRSGPYSAAAKGIYNANTLSLRHKQWGAFWAERGFLAMHVDSFGPRGYPQGFPIGSYSRRPAEVSEQTVRPLDAYGALDYLRSRGDVIQDRVGLQGWSNGAMAGLATLAAQPPGMQDPTPATAFRAALLFYPGCRIQLQQEYRPYTPTIMFIGSEDEEVAPVPCRQLTEQARARGVTHFEMIWYDGATHSFDEPGSGRQAVEANRKAWADSMQRSERFFQRHLKE